MDAKGCASRDGTSGWLPFEPGEYRRIAAQILDDRGIEGLKLVEVAFMRQICEDKKGIGEVHQWEKRESSP